MPLDISKLKHVRHHEDGKLTAQCPACAELGGDSKGTHLAVFGHGSGAFNCIASPGDKEHNQRIFALAGLPSEAHAPGPQPAPPRPAKAPPDWSAACKRLADDRDALDKLAKWRGWTVAYCGLLADNGWIGLYEGRVAFPVREITGKVTGLHVFPWPDEKAGGRKPWYAGGKALPLILGAASLEGVGEVHVCESQWDALSLLHAKGWDGQPRDKPIVVTRGTSVNPCITEWLDGVSKLVLWPQQDEPKTDGRIPSADWMDRVIKLLPASVAEVRRVDTPAGFKDWNDVLRERGTEATGVLVDAGYPAASIIAQPGAAASVTSGEGAASFTNLPTPEPLPTALLPVQPFNDAWLPETLRPWIADVAERMQCPPDFPAVAAMVALSSIVGTRCAIQPKELDTGWYEHPNLWGMIVGRPSLMKSPAMQAAMRPLRRLESDAFNLHKDMERERDAAAIKRKFEREGAIKEARKAQKDKSVEFDYSALVEDTEEDGSALRRFIVNDCSIEALGEVLMGNPVGTLLYQDELAGLLALMEKDGNQALRAFMLSAWTGKEGFTFDRIGRGVRRVEKCAVSVLGGIQPGVLAARIRDAQTGGAGDDGLIQRFSMLVWPDVSGEWRNVDRVPHREREKEADAVFDELERMTAAHLQRFASPNQDNIPTFRFTPEAQECFRDWNATLQRRLRCAELTPAMEAHLGKYCKLVPALALLTHLAERQTGCVALAALEKAIAWATYLESHAARAYGSRSVADVEGACSLLKRLQNGSARLPSEFTAREVNRKGWSGMVTSQEAGAACEVLAEYGWLLTRAAGPKDVGGRSTVLFHLNPLVKTGTSRA